MKNNPVFVFLFFFFSGNLFSQENNPATVIQPGTNVNHTQQIQDALSSSKKFFLKNGDYYINYDQIVINGKIEMEGESKEGVRIHGIGDIEYKSANPSFIFKIKSPVNISFSNITFIGEKNVAVAIKVSVSDLNIANHTDIIINNNISKEIGLIWVSPEKGFTFNRMDEGSDDWGQFGPIKENNWKSNIKISKNKCLGNTTFYSGNLKENSTSAISLLFSNNVNVTENEIRNFKFGIWVYGGGTRTVDKKQLSTNPILAENIYVAKNNVYETYGAIWFSRAKKIIVENNNCVNNEDVNIDFEGCENGIANNNNVTNSRGGALVVLNGSKNITFTKNYVRLESFNKLNNMVLIRDGDMNITYDSNTFEFVDGSSGLEKSRVFFKKSSDMMPNNSKIFFLNNTFKNVFFDIRGTSETSLENNQFSNDVKPGKNLILLSDNSVVNIKNNTVNSDLVDRNKHISIR